MEHFFIMCKDYSSYIAKIRMYSFVCMYIIFIENFKGVSATAISPTELLELLQSKDVSNTVDTCGRVFSEEELDKLLDRSDMLNLDKNNNKENTDVQNTAGGGVVDKDSGDGGGENQHFKVINVSASPDGNIVF